MKRAPMAMFIPGDLDHNYRQLLLWKKLIDDESASDEEVANVEPQILKDIAAFTIMSTTHPDLRVEVGPGRFKTALLVHYISCQHESSSFDVKSDEQALIRQYFTGEVIDDALSNAETKHLSVQALLFRGAVCVECARQ